MGADAYLSIHADGASPSARGFHLIRPSGRPGTDVSVVEPSAALATVIRDHLVAAGFSVADYTGDRGIVARDDLATLNLSSVPVVLLEAGNMRNPDDAAMLLDAAVSCCSRDVVGWSGTSPGEGATTPSVCGRADLQTNPPIAAARLGLSYRAARWVTSQVGYHGRSGSEVAGELGCDWHPVGYELEVVVDRAGQVCVQRSG